MPRRAISVRGSTYSKAKDYCDKEGLSVSNFLELLIAANLPEPYASGDYPDPPKKPTGRKPKDLSGVHLF